MQLVMIGKLHKRFLFERNSVFLASLFSPSLLVGWLVREAKHSGTDEKHGRDFT